MTGPPSADPKPPPAVLAAYGVTGPPMRLTGGQGTSFRAGDLVLKPHTDPELAQWWFNVTATIDTDDIVVPPPIPDRHGRLAVNSWSATRWVPGDPVDPSDTTTEPWLAVLNAARTLHQVLAGQLRPEFLSRRHDRWAVADRTAWGEGSQPLGPRTRELIAVATPLLIDEQLPAQLIHGDLSGNVLLDPTGPPAVIDIAPYWRPALYADAIVVIDALLWWDTDPTLIDVAHPTGIDDEIWISLLTRAWMFRLLAYDESTRTPSPVVTHELDKYRNVLTHVRSPR